MLPFAFALLLASVAPPPEPARQAAQLIETYERLLQENGPSYRPAVAPMRQALAIYRRFGSQREIADALRRILRLDPDALPYATELAALDRADRAARPVLAEDELFLALHFYQQRRFRSAFSHLQRAKEAAAAEHDVALLARCYTAGGNIRDFRGEAVPAIAEWREADRLYGLAGDRVHQAHARSNLGRWLLESGEYRQALGVLESALALSRSIESSLRYRDEQVLNDEAMGQSFAGLAQINRRLGRPDQALSLFEQARNKFRWALSPGQAYMHMIDMADIYSDMGRDREAERFYELVLLASPADASGTEAFQPLRVRIGYARHLMRTHRPAEARELLIEALDIAVRHGSYGFAADCMLGLGTAETSLGNAAVAGQWFDRALRLATAHSVGAEITWRAHYGKGRSLAAAGKRDRAAAEYRLAVTAIESWLGEIPDKAESPASTDTPVWEPYHDLLIEEIRRGATDRAFGLAERAKMALVTLALPSGSRQNLRPIRALTAAEAIELARSSGISILDFVLAGRAAFVFVIDAQGIRVFELPAGAPRIRELATELATTFRDPFWASRSAIHSPAALALYRAVIPPPVEVHLQHTASLVVIPDAELWLVPFEMLWHSSAGRNEYLIERFPLCYAPSVSVMRFLQERGALRHDRRDSAHLRIAVLLAGQAGDAELLAGLRSHAAIIDPTQATRSAARTALEQMDVVHFGCHGTYNEKYPLDSALLLSSDGASFLEAREIATMHIGARLVTFAACDSGRGAAVRGQGLLGMTWAALRGGAASAAAMRWRVDGPATARLFASFYRNVDRGDRQDLALRSAQLELIRSTNMRNPYYWAGVMLVGCDRVH